jgi:hypothetical protein
VEPLNCPFCGSEYAKSIGRCIECRTCGASGPEAIQGSELITLDDAVAAWNRRTPTAPEPVKVTEAMVDRAVATFEAGMGEAQCEATDASFRALMRKTFTAALSAHHPEVQPAEPIAWCCGGEIKGFRAFRHPLDTCTVKTPRFDTPLYLDEQRARELAAQQGEPKA